MLKTVLAFISAFQFSQPVVHAPSKDTTIKVQVNFLAFLTEC